MCKRRRSMFLFPLSLACAAGLVALCACVPGSASQAARGLSMCPALKATGEIAQPAWSAWLVCTEALWRTKSSSAEPVLLLSQLRQATPEAGLGLEQVGAQPGGLLLKAAESEGTVRWIIEGATGVLTQAWGARDATSATLALVSLLGRVDPPSGAAGEGEHMAKALGADGLAWLGRFASAFLQRDYAGTEEAAAHIMEACFNDPLPWKCRVAALVSRRSRGLDDKGLEAVLQEATRSWPGEPFFPYADGLARLAADDGQGTVACFTEALRQRPDWEGPVGNLIAAVQKYASVISDPTEGLTEILGPESPVPHFVGAVYWQEHRDYAQVAAHLERAEAGGMKEVGLYLQWSSALGKLERTEEARAVLVRCARAAPENVLALDCVASQFLEAGVYDQSARILGLLLEVSPTDPLAPRWRFLLGRALFQAGDRDGGLASYMAGLAGFPDDFVKAVEVGQSLVGAGRSTEGLDVLADFVSRHPAQDTAAFFLGDLAVSVGAYDKALEVYKAMLEAAYPARSILVSSIQAHMAHAYAEAGQWERAMEAGKAAVEGPGPDAEGYVWLGRALEELGNQEEALENYRLFLANAGPDVALRPMVEARVENLTKGE